MNQKEGIILAVVNNLKETRIAKGSNQKDLSIATGFSTRTVSRVERGLQDPSAEFMLRVSKYLKVLVEDIFDVEE